MATISELRPLLSGPPLMLDSASRRVSLSRFLNALIAAFNSSEVGVGDGVSGMAVLFTRCELVAAYPQQSTRTHVVQGFLPGLNSFNRERGASRAIFAALARGSWLNGRRVSCSSAGSACLTVRFCSLD